MTPPVLLWGGTGQAKVLRGALRLTGHEVVAVIDRNPAVISPFQDLPLSRPEQLDELLRLYPGLSFVVAIGGEHGKTRLEVHRALVARGLAPLTVVHPTAHVAADARLGEGAQVLMGALVAAEAELGQATIVNTGAQVDHECRIGDGVHLCPGVKLAGCVQIDAFATLGTGAVVLPRVHIGEGAVVGAGAVVRSDVAPRAIVVGVPARTIGQRNG